MARRIADDTPWHASALTLLDTLWSLDTHMGVIRRRLAVTLGFNPSPEQVRAQAERFKSKPHHVRRAPTRARILSNAIVRDELFAMRLKPGPPTTTPVDHGAWVEPLPMGRHADPVRLVEKGTFKASNFSMLGGTLRGP